MRQVAAPFATKIESARSLTKSRP